MAILDAPRPASAPPPARRFTRPKPQPKWVQTASQVWGILSLLGHTARALVTPPFLSWRGELIEQAWWVLKKATIPALISMVGFGYGAPGVTGSAIAELLGDPTRIGAIVGTATLRENAVWITAMVVAGVGGTAMCADLGARKVRDELSALEVMGIDPIRKLVAPRVLALIVLMPALTMVAVAVESVAILLANLQVASTVGGYFEASAHSFNTIDVIGALVKTTLFGAVIGAVCCYKGMNAKGGPVGVGRAVNQAVVISFVLVWVINYAFNSTYLGAFPGAQAVR